MESNNQDLSGGQRFLQTIGRLPGVLKVASLFYCLIDNRTPIMVRLSGLFALIYLIFPIDPIPDVLLFLFGLGVVDDAAVIYMAYKVAEEHILPEHREKALELFNLSA